MIENLNNLCFGNRGIPTVFDQEIDYYSVLCKLYGKLEEVIAQVNADSELYTQLSAQFNQLKAWVEHYFDDLNIQEEVNKKIDELIASGEFVRMMAQAVLEVPVVNNPLFSRTFNYTTKNLNHKDPDTYYFMQGGCFLPDKNAYVYAKTGSNTSLTRLTVIDYETGAEIKANHVVTGHSNWITYNPADNELYITDVDTSKVYVVDYTTLTVVRSYDLTDEIEAQYDISSDYFLASVDYDYITGKYIAWLLYSENLHPYVHTAFEYNFETRTLTKLNVNDAPIKTKQHYQGACVHNNMLYYIGYNEIYCFGYDVDTYKCVNVINIPERFSDGVLTGEPENISVKSLTSKQPTFVYGSVNLGLKNINQGGYCGWFYSILMSEFNPFTDIARSKAEIDASIVWASGANNVHFNLNAATAKSDGTEARPYTNIADALEAANYKHVGVQTVGIDGQVVGDILLYNMDIPYISASQCVFNSFYAADSTFKMGQCSIDANGKAIPQMLANVSGLEYTPAVNLYRSNVDCFYFNTSAVVLVDTSVLKGIGNKAGITVELHPAGFCEVDVVSNSNSFFKFYDFNTEQRKLKARVRNSAANNANLTYLSFNNCNMQRVTIYQSITHGSSSLPVFNISASFLMEDLVAATNGLRFSDWAGDKAYDMYVTLSNSGYLNVRTVCNGSTSISKFKVVVE